MQFFDDRTSTMTIYTLKSPTRKPTPKDCRAAPPIIMDKSCGFPFSLNSQDFAEFKSQTAARGYQLAYGPDFISRGEITCSDPNRQVSPGLIYYCLTGESDLCTRANPNDPIFLPENVHSYVSLDYRPSPDDLPWKPYRVKFDFYHFQVDFMALDPDGKVLTATLSCPKLSFHFEFHIAFPKTNEYENYICRWSPVKGVGINAPFSVLYELYLNSTPFSCGIARRTLRFESHPGVRSANRIDSLRVYGDEVHILG